MDALIGESIPPASKSKPTPASQSLKIEWKEPDLVLKRRRAEFKLTPKELDELCHWALSVGLLPALAAEIRGLVDVPATDLPSLRQGGQPGRNGLPVSDDLSASVDGQVG